jgi:hypothetical protein
MSLRFDSLHNTSVQIPSHINYNFLVDLTKLSFNNTVTVGTIDAPAFMAAFIVLSVQQCPM